MKGSADLKGAEIAGAATKTQRRRAGRAAVILLALLAGNARGQAAGGGAGTVEIHLLNVRWQALPADIVAVYRGADGRIWYVGEAGKPAPDVAACKAQIAGQWGKAAPVLHGVRPCLFESGGRAWFVTADGRHLLGYDGNAWIERDTMDPETGKGFIGDDPHHGRTTATAINLDLGEYQIFTESSGFEAFDGKQWIAQRISPHDNGPLTVLPDPSGGGALAIQSGPAHLWRFAKGEWKEVALPTGWTGSLQSAALSADGTLLGQTIGGGVRTVFSQNPEKEATPKEIDTAIAQVLDANVAVEQQGVQALEQIGVPAVPAVQEALNNLNNARGNPPVRVNARPLALLTQTLQQLNSSNERFMVGSWDMNQCDPSVYSDEAGNEWIGCAKTPGQELGAQQLQIRQLQVQGLGQGVLVINGPGVNLAPAAGGAGAASPMYSAAFLRRAGAPDMLIPGRALFNFYAPYPAPISFDGGKVFWQSMPNGAREIDVSGTAPVIKAVPDENLSFVQAEGGKGGPEGTVFLSAGPANLNLTRPSNNPLPIVAYHPGASDNRRIAKPQAVPADEAFGVLASDGSLWTALADGGISRFDGKAWSSQYGVHYQGAQLYAGGGDAVLVWEGKWFTLFEGKDRFEHAGIDDLVREHAAAFAVAFGGAGEPNRFRRAAERYLNIPEKAASLPQEGGWSIAADKDKHVWLTISRTLRVLDGGKWVQAEWPANLPGPSGVTPIGDGSAMYVWSIHVADRSRTPDMGEPKCFIGKYQDGKIALTAAPGPTDFPPFADAERHLWIMERRPADSETNPDAQGVRVQRVGTGGVMDTFDLTGEPLLLDKSGTVWLAGKDDALTLWRKGRIAGQVSVPGSSGAPRLFSEKAGSVWVWTALGLNHFVAEHPDAADYTLRQTVFPVGAQGESLFRVTAEGDAGVSPAGFFFTMTEDPGGPAHGKRVMYTLPLPRD